MALSEIVLEEKTSEERSVDLLRTVQEGFEGGRQICRTIGELLGIVGEGILHIMHKIQSGVLQDLGDKDRSGIGIIFAPLGLQSIPDAFIPDRGGGKLHENMLSDHAGDRGLVFIKAMILEAITALSVEEDLSVGVQVKAVDREIQKSGKGCLGASAVSNVKEQIARSDQRGKVGSQVAAVKGDPFKVDRRQKKEEGLIRILTPSKAFFVNALGEDALKIPCSILSVGSEEGIQPFWREAEGTPFIPKREQVCR